MTEEKEEESGRKSWLCVWEKCERAKKQERSSNCQSKMTFCWEETWDGPLLSKDEWMTKSVYQRG